jgi:hypothetical protein
MRPASRRCYRWAPQVEVVESRCLLSGAAVEVVDSTETMTLTDPNDVFTSTEPGPGDVLAEELAVDSVFIDILFDAILNEATQTEADPPLELPAVLTAQELVDQAGQLGTDGLPFITGVPVLVNLTDGTMVNGIIVAGEGQGVLTNEGVLEAAGTLSIGVIGTGIDVTAPFIPDGTLTIGVSGTITDSIPDGTTETGLVIDVIFEF